MCIKKLNPYTPSTRYKIIIKNKNLTNTKNIPKTLIKSHSFSSYGRNNTGHITIRHRNCGHKKKYRIIDFKRNKYNIYGSVVAIHYDPNRNVPIALIKYDDNTYRYILYPESLKMNNRIKASLNKSPMNIGDSLYLKDIPTGSFIHNIAFKPLQVGKISHAAGTYAKILAKESNFILIQLPSKQLKCFLPNCRATFGRLSNIDYKHIKIGKAGRNCWYGIRPTVRGSAMNPVDHPHGGGEGRSPIGKPNPRTPWGKIALGIKTKKRSKVNDKFMLRKTY